MRQILVFIIFIMLSPLAFFVPFTGLVSYVAIAYTRPHQWAYMPSAQFSLAVAVATLIGYMLFELTQRAPRLSSNWMLLMLWVQLSLATLVAPSQELAQGKWLEFSKTFLISLLMTAMVDSERRARWLLLGTTLAIGFLAFRSNFGILATMGQTRIYGPGGAFEDNNDYALLLNVAIPIAYFTARGEAKRWLKIICYLVTAMMVITVPFTLSRGGFLGLVVVLVGIAWRSKHRLAGVLAVLLFGGLTFGVLPNRVIERVGSISSAAETDQSAQMRFDSWRVSWQIMNDHPIFGIGPRNMTEVYNLYNNTGTVRVSHNSFLQMGVDGGLPALALFLGLMVLSFWRFRLARRILQEQAPDSALIPYSHGMEIALYGYFISANFLSRHDLELLYQIVALAASIRLIAAEAIRKDEAIPMNVVLN